MTWIAEPTTNNDADARATGSERWYVKYRQHPLGPPIERPVFGPLAASNASQLALLLNDMENQRAQRPEPIEIPPERL